MQHAREPGPDSQDDTQHHEEPADQGEPTNRHSRPRNDRAAPAATSLAAATSPPGATGLPAATRLPAGSRHAVGGHYPADEHGHLPRVAELIEEFLAARAVRKPSVHTLQAYRRDLGLIVALIGPEPVTLGDLSPRVLRSAFARFAGDRAPASVARAWSSWNAFLTFLVTEQVVAGN